MKIVVHKSSRDIINSYMFYNNDIEDGDNFENNEDYEIIEVSDSYLHSLEPDYRSIKIFKYINGEIVVEDEFNEDIITNRIQSLKQQLTDSDYKIVKAYEAQLINGSTTYDFEEVHAERQSLRDEINELEAILMQHKNDKE